MVKSLPTRTSKSSTRKKDSSPWQTVRSNACSHVYFLTGQLVLLLLSWSGHKRYVCEDCLTAMGQPLTLHFLVTRRESVLYHVHCNTSFGRQACRVWPCDRRYRHCKENRKHKNWRKRQTWNWCYHCRLRRNGSRLQAIKNTRVSSRAATRAHYIARQHAFIRNIALL